MRTRTLITPVLCGLVLLVSSFTIACGSAPTEAGTATRETRSSAELAPSTASTAAVTAADSSWTPAASDEGVARSEIAGLFADLACELAPLPVYGLGELPTQVSIASEWWPAISMDSPSAYEGPRRPNPWVSDSPAGTREAQVLLRMGEGWLVIIENFRGDLGDVRGVSAGSVAGRPAMLFELAQGVVLVQWSDRGAWYSVLGRGVDADDVVRTANSLVVIPPAD